MILKLIGNFFGFFGALLGFTFGAFAGAFVQWVDKGYKTTNKTREPGPSYDGCLTYQGERAA